MTHGGSRTDYSTGAVMTLIARIAALTVALGMMSCGPTLAQAPAELTNSKIEFAYFPPKTVKYHATMDRLKSRQVLEQLSQFLAPLRLPHKLFLVTEECGENPSPHYDPGSWASFICYGFSEILARFAAKPAQPVQGFSHDEVVVGTY